MKRVVRALDRARTDPIARAELPRKAVAAVKKKVRPEPPRHAALASAPSPTPVDPKMRVPKVAIPDGPVTRPHLRVAVILDPFSSLAFGFEWSQFPVSPTHWRDELTRDRPDLLFIESAWNGNDGAWRLAMTKESPLREALAEMVAWCRGEGIPTVFWNKEDPPNYEVFIRTAQLFDQVFTVDADRIPAYVEDLGHDRVGLLPFAAQPRIHNPIRHTRTLIGEVAFAGTYFVHKHADRRAQMDYLLPAAADRGLDIYSRMQDKKDPRYLFPAQFRSAVVGTLPYEQMLAASTCYRVFLNVNSVTESPTMCARRLFELSAAQTTILSGPAASIEPFFGDTITVAHDAESARLGLGALLDQSEHRDRLGLRAHRRVFDEHLYTDRVDTVLATLGLPPHTVDQSVSAIVPTMRPGQIEHVLRTVAAQVHTDLELILLPHGFDPDRGPIESLAAELGVSVQVVPVDKSLTLGAVMNVGVQAAAGRYVAKMDDDNDYGPHYLSDLVRAFSYSTAEVVGKWAHYVHLAGSNATLLRFAASEHRYVRLVQGGTILTPRDVALRVPFRDVPRRVDTTFLNAVHAEGGKVYAADRFNFVSRRGVDVSGHTWSISDAEILSRGSRIVFYGGPLQHAMV